MAKKMVKSTYSLDEETVRDLERLARRLEISKSEALRRAVRLAARTELAPGEEEIEALDELQRSLGSSTQSLREWERQTHDERKATSRR